MSKVSVNTKVKSAVQLLFKEVELLVCPIIVFCIGYLHHVYFSYDLISPIFVVLSLLSTLLVLAYNRPGFIAASVLQVGLLAYVLVDEPALFLEQSAFSLSVVTALAATLLSRQDIVATKPKTALTLAEQKDKLWQELFDARKEIKQLYSQKEELLAKIAETAKEKTASTAHLEHQIEALQLEKTYLLQEQDETEKDIALLLDKMHEMAQRKPEVASKSTLEPFEAQYKQLKIQFEEKSQVLDSTRKELFLAQEEIQILNRTLELEVQVPTVYEKALTDQLAATSRALDDLQKKHHEELMGYEEVIHGLHKLLNK